MSMSSAPASSAHVGSKPTSITGRVRNQVDLSIETIGGIRIPEFVLFFLLIAHSALPIPSLGFPLSHLIMAALVALSLLRRPTRALGTREWVLPVFAIGLAYVSCVSIYATPTEFAADWQGRALRIAVTFMLAMVIGSGRICLKSGLFGLLAALFLNVPLFLAGLLPAPYGEYLTGFIGDKNVAGMIYCIVGVLAFTVVRNTWAQFVLVVFFSYSLWLTGSRASMTAFACALVWMLVAPKLPVLLRWLLGAGIYFAVELLSEDYSQIGVFSDREGSDLLRARIDAAAEIKTQQAGFFGEGLGEAYVVFLDDPSKPWFFHNSYFTALVEGGWPWLAVLMLLTCGVIVRPFTSKLTRSEAVAQAAGVAMLVCATRLGEVFFTSTWAILLGAALYAASPERSGGESASHGPDRERALRTDRDRTATVGRREVTAYGG